MKNLNDEENEKLRKLNEEKKRQIEAEFGAAIWGKSDTNDLPPEIENQFLENIMAFEKNYKESKRITVFDFLGKPGYKKAEDLNNTEIHDELERLQNIMQENDIRLDTICEVPERELYRFITEELFFHETDDVRIPGLTCCYIYEEFHPNHEHDIRSHSEDFFSRYLDKTSEYYNSLLTSKAQKLDWHRHFRDAFNSFDIIHFKIKELNFDTENATVVFECKINAKVEGARELFTFAGAGSMKLNYEWEYWSVDSIVLPESKLL